VNETKENMEPLKTTDSIENWPNLSMRKCMTRVYDELLAHDDVVYLGLVFYYFVMGEMFWLFIVGLFRYICIFYYLYVDFLTYAFG
jgi:hypothetical protein